MFSLDHGGQKLNQITNNIKKSNPLIEQKHTKTSKLETTSKPVLLQLPRWPQTKNKKHRLSAAGAPPQKRFASHWARKGCVRPSEPLTCWSSPTASCETSGEMGWKPGGEKDANPPQKNVLVQHTACPKEHANFHKYFDPHPAWLGVGHWSPEIDRS